MKYDKYGTLNMEILHPSTNNRHDSNIIFRYIHLQQRERITDPDLVDHGILWWKISSTTF